MNEEKTSVEVCNEKVKEVDQRRTFMKKLLLSGVAISSTAVLANKVSRMIPVNTVDNWKRAGGDEPYLKWGDSILTSQEFTLMSEEEKNMLLESFIEEYNKNDKTYLTIKEV